MCKLTFKWTLTIVQSRKKSLSACERDIPLVTIKAHVEGLFSSLLNYCNNSNMKLLAFIFASLTTHILVQGQTTEAPCYNYVPGVEYCPTDQPGVEFYYWDNQHCSKYYVCLNGCRESYTCPHDWLFDADNNWCTSPEQVKSVNKDKALMKLFDNFGTWIFKLVKL